MSIDSTSSSPFHRKKTLKPVLSQSDNYSYSRHSLKDHKHQFLSKYRTMSVSEETSGDILTDLSSLPHNPYQQINDKRNRRFSELKPTLSERTTNSDRRSSIPQINFSSLLPNPFRSNKHHHHKNITKDETNVTNNTSSLYSNNIMTTKAESSLSSLKSINITPNGSRTNLTLNNERSSTFLQDDTISSATSLFIVDPIQSEPRSTETLMLKLHTPLCIAGIYREEFFEYFHINYCGEFEQEGPFIASLRYYYIKPTITDDISSTIDTNTNCQARAIIRISNCNHDVSVMVDGTNEDNILQILFNKAHLSAIHTCKTIGDPKANEKIYLFDKLNDERQNCKIGFIYQRLNQTDEYDIFSNDDMPKDMLDFLKILAEPIRLKGFNKYRGDLDTKDDLHGEYSYYTQYKDHEIMFNVAPMIPSAKANGQCIERKGLVANSFVCVVYQDSDAEFSPEFIFGRVTQVYITVQPIRINEQLHYKISIWHRNDVTSLIDPPGGIYEYDESFRDYFLTLLLNSINVAIESPRLRFRIAEQRQRIKQEELRKLSENLSIGQILDTITELENITCQTDQRFNSRSEGNFGTLTQSMTDIITQNSGRVSPAKKRSLSSKLFGVFTNRSGSISSTSPSLPIPPPPIYADISPITPSSPEINSIQTRSGSTLNKEPIKRMPSIKLRPAPPPPIQSRMPTLTTTPTNISSTPSSNPSIASLHSSLSHSLNSTNDNILLQNNRLSSSVSEEILRNRANSSPGENFNITTKARSMTISRINEEIDDINTLTDDDFDDELNEDEKNEHHQTLTEPPLLLTSNTNS